MSAPWTLEEVLKLREEISARPRPVEPVREEGLHDRAALVTSFVVDPDLHAGVAGANLIEDSLLASAGRGGRWSLKNDVRKRVLGRLQTEENLRAALLTNPERPDDLVQQTIEAWLRGQPKPLDEQTPEELSATLQVVDWFSETELARRLPSGDAVRTRVEYAAFLQPLRSLVGTHFRGRVVELAALAAYVGAATNTATLRERPPVLIFGPGGMGKSTLVAKFILDHLGKFPIVYLDCDRPGLVAAEPITLLAEAVYQLGLQFPRAFDTARKLRDRWLREVADFHEATRDGQRGATLGRVRMMEDFRVFVQDLALRDRRIVLVVDTFEEIYARSRAFVQEMFKFLDELQALLPNLRTILAGRHPIPDFKWEPLELDVLDQEAAQAFLGALGVASAPLRERLASLLRGNPLSLRLAATMTRKEDATGLEELEELTDDTEIQGILYRRILGHVREEVRQLAHPGLILRRITADLIRLVLAGPCGVAVPGEVEAQRLFDFLQNELSLVNQEGNAVRHRSDVRRVMLRPLKKDQPEKVRAIEEEAIKYYEASADPVSRAEEIYHRLSLGQTPEEVEGRWLPGIEESLRSAVEELTGPARAYLASRLQMELYDEDWENADQRTWELHTENRTRDLLLLDRPLDALQALRRRSTRLPRSPLYWYQAQALRRNGQLLEAFQVARSGLAQLLEPTSESISDSLAAWFAGQETAAPPTTQEVLIHTQYLELLRPLRANIHGDFAGRERELETLRSYVTGGSPVTNLDERPPLLIHGPGGVGKSTLVAKFILDHLGRLPFVHLDCAGLNPEKFSPVWLLWEVARQLALQYPAAYLEVREEIDHWHPGAMEEALESGAKVFGKLLGRWMPEGQRIVLFIDSFEEWPWGFEQAYDLLRQLQKLLPCLRAIFVSKTEMPNLRFERLAIGVLDREAALAFLEVNGVASAEVRHELASLVGESPYALRLAAEAIRQEGPAALDRLRSDPKIATELIFQRVLSHLHDPDLRRLVPAALLLRRVTPELLQILTGLLYPEPRSLTDSASLLHSLGAQVSLFTRDGEILLPRVDVRRLLLHALRNASSEAAAAIDEAAVKYYEARSGSAARAEEVYHRLVLGQPPEVLDSRWVAGIEQWLRGALEDVHGASRLYLASRLGIELADAEWKEADQPTWERFAARRARELLALSRYTEALELLRQRSTRLPQTPLFALEAEALYSVGSVREALSVARRGLEHWPNDPALPPLISRCEAAMGVGESVSSAPAETVARRGAVESFILRDDFNMDQLTDALRKALPFSTDLVSVLRSMNVDSSTIGTIAAAGVEEAIRWARETARLNELLQAVAAYSSSADSLREFIAGNVLQIASREGSDPLAAVLLPGGRPFLNRQILRSFLRSLLSPAAEPRILVVNGPAGSGKSYTANFVQYVAGQTKAIEAVSLQSRSANVEEFVASIYEGFGWRWEGAGAPENSGPDLMQRLARGIHAKAKQSKTHKLLVIDSDPATDLSILEFVRCLVGEGPLSMSMILIGYPRPIPATAQLRTVTENLELLTTEEILDALKSVLDDGEFSLFADGSTFSGLHSNSEINRVFQEILHYTSPAFLGEVRHGFPPPEFRLQ